MVNIQFNDQYGNTIKRLTQWDSNVILTIPNFKYGSAPVFHFNNGTGSTSITVTSVLNEDTVSVVMPNILFTRAKPIEVFVFLYDPKSDEGRTIYQTTIPVTVKPKPDDYEYIDNTEIIEITSLGIRLQALIDEAERSVNVHIKELEDSYNNTIQTIRQSIADDVTNLNQSISNNRDVLERDISNNLQTILSSIDDGTPKGIFSDVSELANKPAGIYLYINGNNENNGYIYYWDGTNLSDRLIHYQGTVLNDGVVVYSNLSDELKKLTTDTIIPYTLSSEDWNDSSIVLDVSDYYTVTENTKADVDFDMTVYEQLTTDECIGLQIKTEKVNQEDKLIIYALGETPTADITIQITIKEVII